MAKREETKLKDQEITLRWAQWENNDICALLIMGKWRRPFLPLKPGIESPKGKLLTHTAPSGHPQLNGHLLEKFANAARILGAPENDCYKVHLIPHGDDATVRVKLPVFLPFEGTLMPIYPQQTLKPEQLA